MNKTELIDALAERTGNSRKDSKLYLESFVDIVTETLAGKGDNEVAILGFGSFKVKERPERMGRNPRTGEPIQIAASRKPEFRPGAALKKAVAGN